MQETIAFIIARYDFFYSFIYCDIKKNDCGFFQIRQLKNVWTMFPQLI